MAQHPKSDRFNLALGVFLRWGPEQCIDLHTRLAKADPNLTPPEMKKLVAQFEELVSASCRIVEEQVEKHQTEEDGRSRVAALDNRMSAVNASLLYHQARYSAWRDGYR